MRTAFLTRATAFLVVAAATLSCDGRQALAPQANPPAPLFDLSGSRPAVVISQVYGGGGNTGATLKNDFIELHNTGSAVVDLTGWSVQYGSATGTTFSGRTILMGAIPPGGYFLIQEAVGSGGTVNLPTPDAIGTIALSATAGKVALVQSTVTLTGSCPSGGALTDLVSFGTTNCATTGTTATLSNTTAALRKDAGCTWTGNTSTAFDVGTPAPRNGATSAYSCGGGIVAGPPATVTLAPDSTRVSVGATVSFGATAKDESGNVTSTTYTWATADATIATITSAGVATGVAVGVTTVTATSANGIVGTAKLVVAPPSINWIDVSSSSTSFPAGFQTQIFATARTGSGGTIIPANFTFESLDPSIATVALVANTGIITGVSGSTTRPGIKITATAIDGSSTYSFTSSSITIETPAPAPTSIYATNDEFGDPAAASSTDPDNLLIVRPQYTLSYNESRGTPNWVSYELDARQTGGQDRCNCFTADPLLPADKQILTSDYTNGGYDRGHMAKSADRTAGNSDNAATFYLSNIVPQMADLNQGVWANFENALSDSARAGRAVYIITGPLYSRSHGLTFLKNEGKVAIPDSTWKVAFIGPVNGAVPFARGDIQAWTDLPGTTLLAVAMPNVAGVRNNPWSMYLTTVDRIETATGYDFLSLLPVAFQTALEAGDHQPTARFSVTGTPNQGIGLAFDGSTSTDPDIGRTDMDHPEALSFAWTFGDGGSATGAAPAARAFGHSGTYTVTLTVTDAWGWPSVISHDVSIAGSLSCPGCIVNQTFVPATGAPVTQTITFAGDPAADYIIDLDDGGSRISTAAVTLNGTAIVNPTPAAGRLRYHVRQGVRLGANNTLTVRLTGKVGSSLAVQILLPQ